MIVCGCSGSGKCEWVARLCEQQVQLLTPPVHQVVWCYAVHQPHFHAQLCRNRQCLVHAGFDEAFYRECTPLTDPNWATLLVLDDMHAELVNKPILGALFTKFSHHNNNSIIYTTQNFYHQGTQSRDVSQNAHYIVLLAQPRDQTIVRSIAQQMVPKQPQYMLAAYSDATQTHYGYLLIDAKPHTLSKLRLRNGLLAGEQDCVYLPAA